MTEMLLGELADIARATAEVATPPGLAGLTTSLVETARRVFGAAACSLAVIDEDADELLYVAASGAGAERILGVRLPIGRGLGGWVAQSGQPIAVSDLAEDRRFARDVAESTSYVPTALMAVPVSAEDEVIGVLTVLDRDATRTGSEHDLELAAAFAAQAATALAAQRAFADAGGVLLRALAAAAPPGRTLAAVLNDRPAGGLAPFAALLATLRRAGIAEQQLALRILTEVVDYSTRA